MAFKELDKRNVSEVENSILESWSGINKITSRQIENRNDSENFVGTREVYTEMISIYFELRYYQFLAQKGYEELIVIAQDTTKYGVDLYGKSRRKKTSAWKHHYPYYISRGDVAC